MIGFDLSWKDLENWNEKEYNDKFVLIVDERERKKVDERERKKVDERERKKILYESWLEMISSCDEENKKTKKREKEKEKR